MDKEYWYRVEGSTSYGVDIDGEMDPGQRFTNVRLDKYEVLRYTPKGVWLKRPFNSNRWVSATSRKRFAHKEKIEAVESFAYRKKYYMSILRARIDTAERMIHKCGELRAQIAAGRI